MMYPMSVDINNTRYVNHTHNTNKTHICGPFVCIFMLMFMLMHARNRICIRVSFSFSLPFHFHKGVGVLRSFSPTSLFEHLSVGQALNPPTQWTTHTECGPCSHAHFGWATTACVSSQKRRCNLHRLAHAARHGYSQAPPHLGTPFPLFDTVHVRKPRSINWR